MLELHAPIEQNAVRASVRFPLHLPVLLETEDASSIETIVETIIATTIDVSANGLLFEAEKVPRVGAKIVFTIAMPSAVMGSSSDVLVHCTGRIVRHQKSEGLKRAAAVIDEYFLKV